ncbi:MAG: YncE family protein [Thermoflavifilum sp.]|nr:YncE family protein [Thermoflavifilum sp.]
MRFINGLLLFLFPMYALVQPYAVVRDIPIGGNGGWDYLSVYTPTHELYVSHGDEVDVVDEHSGKLITVIHQLHGVHGIAFVPDLNKAYISNGRSNEVTVVDIIHHRVLHNIATGQDPDAILFEPFTHTIITCNGRSHDLSVIDPVNDRVIHTIPVDGKPETAVSDLEGHLFVNIEDRNEIQRIDLHRFQADYRWPLNGGMRPTGLSIDWRQHRLFAGCGNQLLVVMNAVNGQVVAKLPIGKGCDGIDFDPVTHHIFSSNGEGTLTVIQERDPEQYKIVQNLKTAPGARTSTIDTLTHHLFLSTARFQQSTSGSHGRPPLVPGSFEVIEVAAL